MHLGAASMIGATGSNGSNNGVPENFDVLTYTDNDLSEVSSIGYTVHNLVVNDPSIFSSDSFCVKIIRRKIVERLGICFSQWQA